LDSRGVKKSEVKVPFITILICFSLLSIYAFGSVLFRWHIIIFGVEFNPIVIEKIVVHDTTIKHDIRPESNRPIIFHITPKKKVAKSLKGESTRPDNIQKNDGAASGLQNKAPNYGHQAGRDINNYEIIPRQLNITQFQPFFNTFPDKNTHVAIVFAGTPDGEILAVKKQIVDILRSNGYLNVEKNQIYLFTFKYQKLFF
jgi:hypothetical protein